MNEKGKACAVVVNYLPNMSEGLGSIPSITTNTTLDYILAHGT